MAAFEGQDDDLEQCQKDAILELSQPQFYYAPDGVEYPCMYLENNGMKLQAIGPLPSPLVSSSTQTGSRDYVTLAGSCVYFGPGDDTAPLLRLANHPQCREFIYVDSHPESHYGLRGGEHLDKFLQRLLALLRHQEGSHGEVTVEMVEEERYYLFRIGESKALHYFVNTPCEALESVGALVALLAANATVLWMHGYSPPKSVFPFMPRLSTVISTTGALSDEDGRPLDYDFNSSTVRLVLIHETEFDDLVGRYFYHADIENNYDDDDDEEEEEEEEREDGDEEEEEEGVQLKGEK